MTAATTPEFRAEVNRLIWDATGRRGLTLGEVRELRVLLAGLSIKDAAVAQGICPQTVKRRRHALYRRFGVSSSLELVAEVLGLQSNLDWEFEGRGK